jgi:hypothetical protein
VPSVTWVCPGCSRRVPNRVPECHCGVRKEDAERAARAAAALPVRPAAGARRPAPPIAPRWRFTWGRFWRDLPRDAKAFAVGFVLILVLAVVWFFVPHRPEPITPVLGWSGTVTAPTPKPTPTPASANPYATKPKRKWFPWW